MPVLKQTNFFSGFLASRLKMCTLPLRVEKRRREKLSHNYHLIIHIARYDLLL